MYLCFIEPELWLIEVLHCGNRDYRPFCYCNLDLDPMTFIYELDLYFLDIYRICKYELPTSRCSKELSSDRKIDRQTDGHDRKYIRRRFAGGQLRFFTEVRPIRFCCSVARVACLSEIRKKEKGKVKGRTNCIIWNNDKPTCKLTRSRGALRENNLIYKPTVTLAFSH